jgi:predicted small metal-binding protein
MYTLTCKDMGMAECDFVASEENVRKIKDAMFAHARDEHPELIAGITFERHRELERLMEERVAFRSAA